MAHFKHSNVISVTAKYWFFNIGPSRPQNLINFRQRNGTQEAGEGRKPFLQTI